VSVHFTEDDDRAELDALARPVRRRQRLVRLLQVAVFVVVVGGWEAASRLGWIDPFFFSMPSAVLAQMTEWVTEGTSIGPLWQQVAVTMTETVIGFLIGAAGGVAFGILLGRSRLLAEVFGMYIRIANSVPRVVLGSIFIIALGLGMASKIALAVVMVFFVVFANAFQGVREADRAMIANVRILGASPWQTTLSVVVPSAMTWILASLRASFGFALVGAVVGEFLGARNGLGLLIATAQGSFNPSGVFAAMIILGALALAADYALSAVERRFVAWKDRAD
jgi:NitT/TauT family transport system permease protein